MLFLKLTIGQRIVLYEYEQALYPSHSVWNIKIKSFAEQKTKKNQNRKPNTTTNMFK